VVLAVSQWFGTDGVRGKANEELTPELVLSLARATVSCLAPDGGRVIIGRDTRVSGTMLEGALVAGFTACGLDVLLAGVIPTPAISFLIEDEHAALGAVISASHNPPEDNGIKFFDHRGQKLSVEKEEAIESCMGELPDSCPVGRVVPLEAAATRYAAFLTGTIEIDDVDLSAHTIVVDCAYGATCAIAPRVLRHFNANVIELHTCPDGDRINQGCGSTHLDPLREAVREHRADLGVAFDGDGDRVMLVSGSGETIDGDHMMGIIVREWEAKGRLEPKVLVATVMSNLGLERMLSEMGIRMVRTPVGDRNVAQEMLRLGAKIGGEQSGHIILSDHSPTGDGILTTVKLLEIAHERGRNLGALAREVPLFPQVRESFPVKDSIQSLQSIPLSELIEAAERRLGEDGRVLVRPSGTQPLVRVMVEGEDDALCREVCTELVEAIKARL
jgi:phosphoglucosamine mutase